MYGIRINKMLWATSSPQKHDFPLRKEDDSLVLTAFMLVIF